jgi:hypothetical protein
VAPLDATGVEMSLVETGAATTGVSDVVRTNAAIVINETVRNAEENENNPWLIDIAGSLSCQPTWRVVARCN